MSAAPPTLGRPGAVDPNLPPPGPGPTSSTGPRADAGTRTARQAMTVVAVFVVLLAGAMIAGEWRQPQDEPWRSPELNAARERLAQDPKNAGLKTEIRELDRRLRESYFHGLRRNRVGAGLLLGAGALFIVAARGVGVARRPQEPRKAAAALERNQVVGRARATAAAVGALGLAGLFALGWGWPTRLPGELAASAPRPATGAGANPAPTDGATGAGETRGGVAATWPGEAELARNWPRFRGHDGRGTSTEADLPLDWDAAAGRGVAWKAAVPLPGYNSPVVWGDRVFLTGGDKKARLVFCFDLGTGALRWQRPVAPTNLPAPALEPPDQSGAAASSVATDGRRVFAIFASGELGALDFEGNLVWHQRLDLSENGFGHASSLVVWHDRLLVQADQGQEEDGKSVLHAFDTGTGKAHWAAKRPVGGSWTTPVVVEVGGRPQVITAGDPWLMAHDADTGVEIWRAKVLGGELAPSPVPAGGVILAVSPGHAFSAVKPDGTGDVTATHVAWKLEADVPDVPTPAATGELLYTASTEGAVFCREIATGKTVWEHRFETELQASPLIAGGRLYLFAQPGNVFVLEAGREFRQLASPKMGEEVYASPAVAGGRLLVRTKSNLFCLGTPAGAGAAAGSAAPPVDGSQSHGR